MFSCDLPVRYTKSKTFKFIPFHRPDLKNLEIGKGSKMSLMCILI